MAEDKHRHSKRHKPAPRLNWEELASAPNLGGMLSFLETPPEVAKARFEAARAVTGAPVADAPVPPAPATGAPIPIGGAATGAPVAGGPATAAPELAQPTTAENIDRGAGSGAPATVGSSCAGTRAVRGPGPS